MNSIILPVWNEPKLQEFIDSVHYNMRRSLEKYEILVIMGDKETLYPNLDRAYDVKMCMSYGDSLERAVLLGFSRAKGDKILVMDSDGSHPVDKLLEMFGYLDTFDMVVGSRFMEDSEFSSTAFRSLVSNLFVSFAKITCGTKLIDPMSGFYAFNKKIINGFRFMPIAWKTCLEIESGVRPTVKQIPIIFSKRKAGLSKTTMKIGLKIIYDLLRWSN